jgi:hypothetical protein
MAAVCLVAATVLAQEKPPTKEELDEVKGIVNDLTESSTEYKTYVDALRKIKITGYLQTQFRLTNLNATGGQFSGGSFPANVNKMFQVRRGRLKVNYDNVLTQFVIQIDAIQTGFTLKDAYLSLTEPWLQSFGFQMGVFDRPFGYEISLSSGSRESPERSRMFQTLFPGERELGAKLFYAPQLGAMSFMRADLGVFNGSGPTANEFDNFKDVIGHIGIQLPFEEATAALDLGVSGYFGKVRNNTKYLWMDGSPVSGVKGFVADSSLSNRGDGVTRRYLGADFQFYIDVPYVGGLTLRGEIISGKQPGASDTVSAKSPNGKNLTTISPAAQPTGPVYQRRFIGWYLNFVQNIGDKEQIVVKYDVYDPNSDVRGSDFIAASNLSAADIKYSTLGLGFIHHWDETIKFVLYYEIVKNEVLNPSTSLTSLIGDVRDNVFTFRVQYKF